MVDFDKKKRVIDAQRKVDEIASRANDLMNRHAGYCKTRNGGIIGSPEHVDPLVALKKEAQIANKELDDAKKEDK